MAMQQMFVSTTSAVEQVLDRLVEAEAEAQLKESATKP